jgi:hypothetical protein
LASIAHATGGSSTKTQKNATKKRLSLSPSSLIFCCHFVNKHKTYIYTYRCRPSPNKKVAKKLFTAEQAGDDSGSGNDGAGASDQTR